MCLSHLGDAADMAGGRHLVFGRVGIEISDAEKIITGANVFEHLPVARLEDV